MSGSRDTAELIKALAEFREGVSAGPVLPDENGDSSDPDQEVPEQRLAALEESVVSLREEVEQVVAQSSQRTAELERSILELSDAVDKIEQRVDAAPSEVEESVEQLSSTVTDVRERQQQQFSTVEDQFDTVEQLLAVLYERIEDNAEEISTNAESLSSITTAMSSLEGDSAVKELRERANKLGVKEADCHSCGEQLQVSLLTAPECPRCAAEFEDITSESGWFRTTNTLV